MTDLRNTLAELVFPNKPTYLGLIVRALVVLAIQAYFEVSPFNFRSRPDATTYELLGLFFLVVPTYSLLIGYAIQAIIRIGTIAENPDVPKHEKLFAFVCLIIVIFIVLYVWLTGDRSVPWYMER